MKRNLTALFLSMTMSLTLGSMPTLANEIRINPPAFSTNDGVTYDFSELNIVQFDSQGNIVPMPRYSKTTIVPGGTMIIQTKENDYFYCVEDSTATITVNFSKGKNAVVGYRKKGGKDVTASVLSGATRYSVPITVPSTGYYYFLITNNSSDDITVSGTVTIK